MEPKKSPILLWLLVAISLAIIGFSIFEPISYYNLNLRWDDWTGFGDFPNRPVTTVKNASTTSSTNNTLAPASASTSIAQIQFQRAKTLWDWLDLLIAPLALAGVAIWFNKLENDRKQEREWFISEQSRNLAVRLAKDAAHETALQAYYDKISEYMLAGKLNWRIRNKRYREIAQLRTFSILSLLRENEDLESGKENETPKKDDRIRKTQIVRFLYGLGLISGKNPLISLSGLDLSHINVINENLANINLSGAILVSGTFASTTLENAFFESAHLKDANFTNAKLRKAVFKNAVFSKTELTGADLLETDLTEQQARWSKGLDSATLPLSLKFPKSK